VTLRNDVALGLAELDVGWEVVDVGVVRPGFEKKDVGGGVLRQAGGEDAAG